MFPREQKTLSSHTYFHLLHNNKGLFMKVIDLLNVARKDSEIFYKRYFTAAVVLELPAKTMEVPIEFTIETSPLSEKTISLNFLQQLDYPLIPLLKEVKTFILEKDNAGALPL
jgi:hypothetical protein